MKHEVSFNWYHRFFENNEMTQNICCTKCNQLSEVRKILASDFAQNTNHLLTRYTARWEIHLWTLPELKKDTLPKSCGLHCSCHQRFLAERGARSSDSRLYTCRLSPVAVATPRGGWGRDWGGGKRLRTNAAEGRTSDSVHGRDEPESDFGHSVLRK